jgi:hypothetical protein
MVAGQIFHILPTWLLVFITTKIPNGKSSIISDFITHLFLFIFFELI